MKYSNFRLPFNTFRPLTPGAPLQLEPASLTHLNLVFVPPAKPPAVIGFEDPLEVPGAKFSLEIDRIKVGARGAGLQLSV
jgi:hypothetical protein